MIEETDENIIGEDNETHDETELSNKSESSIDSYEFNLYLIH